MNQPAVSEIELRQRLSRARQIVVKLGTQLLTGPDGHLDEAFFRNIAAQIASLRQRGVQVTVVSSGAIGAGLKQLRLQRRPSDVAELQAVAAVGQPQLMRHMRQAFEPFGLQVAQLLLTRSDFDDRVRFLNLRNCIQVLHRMGCVPIVNENDTVAVEEIRFGDNDVLAALLTNALPADALILLTVVDGLLDENGQVVKLVDDPKRFLSYIRSTKSPLGSGGMSSKHTSAALVAEAGEIAIIANGRTPDILPRLLAGESLGTLFVPAIRRLDARRRWIGLTRRPAGTIQIDAGAVAAITQRGKSLLASGITAVHGDFDRGAVVAVIDPENREIARGLTNYSAEELQLIKGKKSSQFEKILGWPAYAEVIHRDNLVVLEH